MKSLQRMSKGGWGLLWVILGLGGAGVLLQLDTSEPTAHGIRALGALFLVLGIACAGAYGMRKWTQRAGGVASETAVPLHVIGTKGMGEGRSLVVVDVSGERFLLGLARDRISLLTRLPSEGHGSAEFFLKEKG